jgi:hypothetical protein
MWSIFYIYADCFAIDMAYHFVGAASYGRGDIGVNVIRRICGRPFLPDGDIFDDCANNKSTDSI